MSSFPASPALLKSGQILQAPIKAAQSRTSK